MNGKNLYPNLENELDNINTKNSETTKQFDQSYRLREISEIKSKLHKEIEQRRKYRKIKKRLFNLFENLNIGLNVISVGTGITGIALLSTVISTPVCIALEGVALTSGLLAGGFSLLNKKTIIKKLEKHDKIQAIAISKMNSISEIVSKALEDGKIDPIEFKIITDEYDKYFELKNKIRKQTLDEIKQDKVDIDSLKKEFLEMRKKLEKIT